MSYELWKMFAKKFETAFASGKLVQFFGEAVYIAVICGQSNIFQVCYISCVTGCADTHIGIAKILLDLFTKSTIWYVINSGDGAIVPKSPTFLILSTTAINKILDELVKLNMMRKGPYNDNLVFLV